VKQTAEVKAIFSSRDLVKAAIQGKAVERIPKGELCIEDRVIEREFNRSGVGFSERHAFVSRLGLDLICLSPLYDASGKLPSPSQVYWPDLERWVLETPLYTFALIDGAFGWGGRIMDYYQFMAMSYRNETALIDLVASVEKLNLELVKRLSAWGVNGIIVAEDIAYQKGLLINPQTIRKLFMPSLARQAEAVLRAGLQLFYHSDGNYGELLPDLNAIGFDGLHCIDRQSGMDLFALQREYGGRICFWGTLDPGELAVKRDPEYLQQLRNQVRIEASRSGYILGTTSGIFEGICLANLEEIYRQV
jgi:uroporphyrinogen decarboxylase